MTNPNGLYLKLLLITIFFQTIKTQCTDGCLKCNVVDEDSSLCDICDVFSFYVPFGNGLCIKVEVENCDVPSSDRSVNKCMKCKDGYIYDTTTRNCKEVAHQIENCQEYDSDGKCQICKKDYMIDGETCKLVDPLIENCLVYTNDDPPKCQLCDNGFYMNFKDNTCVSLPSDSDCLMYTRRKCLSCQNGYLLNDNYSLNQEMTSGFLQNLAFASFISESGSTGVNNLSISNCQKVLVADCLNYETFEKCSNCNLGFYLAEEGKSCLKYPEDPIKLCEVYSTNTTCSKCVNGAYKNGLDCLESTNVDGCIKYSQSEDKCLECEYGKYLNNSLCVSRDNSLQSNQCQTLNPEDDLCSLCNPGFTLNNANTECVAIIENCINNGVDGSNNPTCAQCEQGYGLNGNVCVFQDIDNCSSFNGTTSNCASCSSGYYLDSNINSCKELTVKNCKIPATDSNECVTCNDYFYLDGGECELQNKSNCFSFDPNTNDCKTCQTKYYLDLNLKSCHLYTTENCKIPANNQNSCEECNDGFFKTSSDSIIYICEKQNLAGCIEHTTGANECSSCQYPGYWLDETSCTAHEQQNSNCIKFEEDNADCKECETGFFLITDAADGVINTCMTQENSLSNCDEYESKLKECKVCENGYNLDSTLKTCSINTDAPINASDSSVGCILSKENEDKCLHCKSGYFLDGFICSPRSTITAPLDGLCNANSHTLDDGICNMCSDSKQFAFSVDKYSIFPLINNCLDYNISDFTCQRCNSGYKTSTDGCDTEDLSMGCILKTSTATSLNDGSDQTDCEKCGPSFYLSTSTNGSGDTITTCEDRGVSVINCDTNGLDPDNDACLYCPENSVYGAMTDIISCTKGSYTGDTYAGLDANPCLIYQGNDLTKCLLCESGKSGDDCATAANANGYIINVITDDLSISGIFDVAETQTNCNLDRISITNLNITSCIECLNETNTDPNRKIIASYDSGNTPPQTFNGLSYDKDNNKSPFTDTFVFIQSCELKATSLSVPGTIDSATTPNFTALFDSTTSTADSFSYLLETVDGHISLGCKSDNEIPTFGTATHTDSTTTVTGADYLVSVISCASDPAYQNIKKRYIGLDYGYQATSALHLQSIIYKDSCKFDTEILVYFFDLISTTNNLKLKAISSGGNAFCVNDELDDLSGSHSVNSTLENCQIFLDATNSDTSSYGTTAQTLKCLSCKPGFYGQRVSATDPTIASCTAITNCDTSLPNFNTWMNSCQKCKSGHAWTYNSSDDQKEFILYHKCSSTTATNCLVVDDASPNNCSFCEPGYTLNSSFECIKIEIDGCSKTSLGRFISSVNLTTAITDTVHIQKINAAVNYLYNSELDLATSGYGCNTCDGSQSYKKISTTTAELCLGTNSFLEGDINCKYHTGSANGGCYECKTEWVLNSDTPPICISNTKGDNCKKVDASGNCTECFKGDPISNDCKLYENCKEINSAGDKCKVCNEGYKPNSSDETECVQVSEDTPCKLFGTDGVCLECKDSTLSPINYFSGTTTKTLFRIVCISKYSDANSTDMTGRLSNAVYAINIEETLFNERFKVIDVNTTSSLLVSDSDLPSPRNTTNSAPYSVCIPKPSTDFCKNYEVEDDDITNNFNVCSECISGYILNSTTKLCEEGSVLNCLSYTADGTTCQKCTADFYLKSGSPESCEVRLDKSCEVYSETADECTSCDTNSYFKDNTCHTYTVEFCKTYDTNDNKCTECVETQRYLDPNGNCIPYTVEFCKLYLETSDECSECEDNRYLNNLSKSCDQYTVTNCDDFNLNDDKCVTCKVGFFLDPNDNCLLPQAENCQERSTTVDKCQTCINEYYLNGTAPADCLENTAQNCSQKSTISNECIACLPAHYTDSNNVCTSHSAEFCNGYQDDKDKCSACIEGYYKDSNDDCQLNTSPFCKTKSTIDNVCVFCKDEYYLNSNNQCEKVTNFTCHKLSENTNDCLSCNPEDYLDSVTKTCMKLTKIENCAQYELNADECDTCNTGYYLSTSKKACYENPNGIEGCTQYQDSLTCLQCKDSTFLEQNKCVDLTEPTVSDCVAYSADGICSVCGNNKFLNSTDNICESATANGCLIYEDKENCAACLENEYLNGTPKVCTATSISGCLIVSGTVDAQTCAVCDSTHYLNTDNECTSVSNTVTDCTKYLDDGICEICGPGQITNSDGSACESLSTESFGLNCLSGTNTASPVCAFCKNGKMIGTDGTCSVSCEISNCMVCNPIDTTKCLMCISGYYMNTKLECVVNGTPSDDENNDSGNSSVSLLNSFILIFLLLNLLWK